MSRHVKIDFQRLLNRTWPPGLRSIWDENIQETFVWPGDELPHPGLLAATKQPQHETCRATSDKKNDSAYYCTTLDRRSFVGPGATRSFLSSDFHEDIASRIVAIQVSITRRPDGRGRMRHLVVRPAFEGT